MYIRKFLTGEIGCKQKSGNDIKYTNYHYVIIDEGQDFSPFQIEIIRSVTNPGSIMILGDLGQSIFDFRAVNKWDQISNLLHDPSYVELMTCYRSTEQITKFANKIIEPWSRGRYNLSLPLLRSGKEPNVLKKSEADWLGEIHNILTNDVTKQYRNIALITRSDEETIELKQKLNISDAEVMVNPDDEYMGGLVMIPAYLSKGIEFDVVIVVDVSKDRYDNNDSDRKLMYVACTRALHELYLISKGEVSPILKEMLN
ncbi:Helicase IV [compost metagenome]